MWRPRLIVLQPTPFCNINCDYCYLRHRDDPAVMSFAVVEAIRAKLLPNIAPDAAPMLIWHAGEPTVVPLSWYRRAYAVLRPALPAEAHFSLQSNGIFASDRWVPFLQETQTDIGLSIDGPQSFHDRRRKTKTGKGTWALAVETLHRMQAAGINPSVVSVLHPQSLARVDEYFEFYRGHDITHVSFSIDEAEGGNAVSSFSAGDYREAITDFLLGLLNRAFVEQFPLHIKEVERIADILMQGGAHNEQIKAWDVIVVAANGDVTTFSPEFMEVESRSHQNFRFGNILVDDFDTLVANHIVQSTQAQIDRGVERCRATCAYFSICGGGAPVNKFQEAGTLDTAETMFCRLSIQTAADALRRFLQENSAERAAFAGAAQRHGLEIMETKRH